MGTSVNSDFFVRARKHRAENRSVYKIREDLSTELTPQRLAPAKLLWVSRKKTITEVPIKKGVVLLRTTPKPSKEMEE